MRALGQQALRQSHCSAAARTCRSLRAMATAPAADGAARDTGAELALPDATVAEPVTSGSRQLATPAVTSATTPLPVYTIISDEVLHHRYLTLYDRVVEHPAAAHTAGDAAAVPPRFAYDVAGHPRQAFKFVVVLPFFSDAGSGAGPRVQVLREYAQGPNAMVWGLPAGGYDPKRHASLKQTAEAELSEECRLRGGELIQLTPPGHPGVVEGKWLLNRFTPFLVINPVVDHAPGQRDAEEHGMTNHLLPWGELVSLIESGDLMPPSVVTACMAMRELRARGLLPV